MLVEGSSGVFEGRWAPLSTVQTWPPSAALLPAALPPQPLQLSSCPHQEHFHAGAWNSVTAPLLAHSDTSHRWLKSSLAGTGSESEFSTCCGAPRHIPLAILHTVTIENMYFILAITIREPSGDGDQGHGMASATVNIW